MKQVVIFSDLDGTLLDAETYAFEMALAALDRIKREGHRSGRMEQGRFRCARLIACRERHV